MAIMEFGVWRNIGAFINEDRKGSWPNIIGEK